MKRIKNQEPASPDRFAESRRAGRSRIKEDRQKFESLLDRGVVEVIDRPHLAERLKKGEKLRVKLGIDPTDQNLHLGHAVVLRKLAQFQKLGHQAVLIIGDWTATVGDPSGRDRTRQGLSDEQVKQNAKDYQGQVFKILNPSLTEVRWQSEWMGKVDLKTLLAIGRRVSVQALLAHETFDHRLKKNLPLTLAELLYPIMQGYDSVQVKADVELGASEQKFNLLMGRIIQKIFNQPPQDVVTVPYLIGTDGKEKMSKSLGNFIGLNDSPKEMYGKVMSIPDELIVSYFELDTDLQDKALAIVQEEVKTKPREAKSHLAKLITTLYHDELQAEEAEAEFNRVFRDKALPQDLPSCRVDPTPQPIIDLLKVCNLVSSKSEARRLIEQGGVLLDGEPVKSWQLMVPPKEGMVVKVGKRRFVRLKLEVKS